RHDRRREAAEGDEGECGQSHRREQRHAHQYGHQPNDDDLDHHVDHSRAASSIAEGEDGGGGRRSAWMSSLAPCSAVIAPPSTIGAYIPATEIGGGVAWRAWFLPPSP